MAWDSGTSGTMLMLLGAAVGLLGVMVTARALLADRSRGRRRCPGCWYDMKGVPGLRCPECGRAAKGERGLLRTRRRWRLAAVGVVVFVLGAGTGTVPKARREGVLSLVPLALLVKFAPTAWDDEVYDTKARKWVLHPVAEEIKRRAATRAWSAAEWRMLLEHARVVRTRRKWVQGTSLLAQPRLPDWLGAAAIELRPELEQANPATIYATLRGPALTLWSGTSAPACRIVGLMPVGVDGVTIRFTLQAALPGSMTGGAIWTIPALRPLLEGTIRVPVQAVEDFDEMLAPDRSEALQRVMGRVLRIEIAEASGHSSAHEGLAVRVALDARGVAKLAGTGVSLWVDLLRDGEAVEHSAAAVKLLPAEMSELRAGGGVARVVTLFQLPLRDLDDPAARERWSIRVRGVKDRLVTEIECDRYWAGEIVIPLSKLLRKRTMKATGMSDDWH